MNNSEFAEQKRQFQEALKQCKNVVISSGAGISAESGIETFRGENGIWQKLRPEELATFSAFMENPAIVWEFYNYRRKIVDSVQPNEGHLALARFEKKWNATGRSFEIITQNVDGLHIRAGSRTVHEVHGNIERMKCSKCSYKGAALDIGVTEKFRESGKAQENILKPEITREDLPKCTSCNALLRPDIVWFGEMLDAGVLRDVGDAIASADMLITVGTSLNVVPASSFPFLAKMFGAKIALINYEETHFDDRFDFLFRGKSGEILPELLDDFFE